MSDENVKKKAFAEQLAEEANKRDMGAIHKITRRLCRTRQKSSTFVRNRRRRIFTTNREQAARLVEPFKSVLNQPCLLNTIALSPVFQDLEISVNKPTIREVADANRSLKTFKTTDIDAVHAEMLKVDLTGSVRVLCPFLLKCGKEKKYQKIGGRD